MERDTIFISHATPDDNDFVRWLGTHLIGHGYRVWADLFELKGGTPFWTTIEDALRHHACKVIFVVSEKSIDPARTGVRNELSVADSIKKTVKDAGFIIPVKIDGTSFADLPIQIHQLNVIDFSKGWGPKLVELLDTLEQANVPMATGNRTPEFEEWRATMTRTSTIVEVAPEPVLTNLLPIEALPETITFFEHNGDVDAVSQLLKKAGVPHVKHFRLIISFAELPALQLAVSAPTVIGVRASVPFATFLEGNVPNVTSPARKDARNMATSLLRQHIEKYLELRGLKRFLSGPKSSFYFPAGLIPNNKVSYVAASGRKTSKNVVGRSERNLVNWHLSMKINVVLGDFPHVRFKPYVCFSEDGQLAIDDAKRTSAIRKRFCKNWWNQHWRQLQEAFCVFLSNDAASTEISLDGQEELILAGSLLQLMADRKIPDDLKFTDEPDDPDEPGDDDPADRDEFNDDSELEEVA
jgi:hypothetical protein